MDRVLTHAQDCAIMPIARAFTPSDVHTRGLRPIVAWLSGVRPRPSCVKTDARRSSSSRTTRNPPWRLMPHASGEGLAQQAAREARAEEAARAKVPTTVAL